jgi:hypothetical protein
MGGPQIGPKFWISFLDNVPLLPDLRLQIHKLPGGVAKYQKQRFRKPFQIWGGACSKLLGENSLVLPFFITSAASLFPQGLYIDYGYPERSYAELYKSLRRLITRCKVWPLAQLDADEAVVDLNRSGRTDEYTSPKISPHASLYKLAWVGYVAACIFDGGVAANLRWAGRFAFQGRGGPHPPPSLGVISRALGAC